MRNNYFLLIPLIILCSMTPGRHISKFNKNKLLTKNVSLSKIVYLSYIGSITSNSTNCNVGAQVYLDSSIGFRYDITFEIGKNVLSHVAFFYKFSNPYQMVEYNYRTHKSYVIKEGSPDKDPNVTVVGSDKIDSFSCTHLYKGNDQESQNYWMSTAVPGFYQMAIKLNNIDPGLEMMAINQTIFNWGGLVRVKMSSNTHGQITTFELNLREANTSLRIAPSTFEVPKK